MRRNMVKNDKVADKREENIKQAVKNNDWEKVSHLLDQPLANTERKDRDYGLLSLNKIIGKGLSTEFGDFIPDKVMNPLESLIQHEEQQILNNALQTLDRIDQQIIHAYVLENKSFSKIAKEIGLSDKTVKKRFVLSLQSLKTLHE